MSFRDGRGGGRLRALLVKAVPFDFLLLARSSLVIAPSLRSSKFALILSLQDLVPGLGVAEGRAAAAEIGAWSRDGDDERSGPMAATAGRATEVAQQGPPTEAPT